MSQSNPTPDPDRSEFSSGTWLSKFIDAASGIAAAFRSESSFYVHLPVGIIVIVAAILLKLSTAQTCILFLCVAFVLTAELFNTAIEALAKAVTREFDPNIQRALDVSAGAVLVASFMSVVVGLAIFGTYFVDRFL